MFAKFAAPFVAVTLATGVMSTPLAYKSANALGTLIHSCRFSF
jgi:hypothetical protein